MRRIRRGLLRRRSLWDYVAELARRHPPRYSHYAYDQRADCFVASLTAEDGLHAHRELLRHAPRNVRAALSSLPAISKVSFFCPRS